MRSSPAKILLTTVAIAAALAACQRREDAEAEMIASHMRGELTFDERFAAIRAKGATYVD